MVWCGAVQCSAVQCNAMLLAYLPPDGSPVALSSSWHACPRARDSSSTHASKLRQINLDRHVGATHSRPTRAPHPVAYTVVPCVILYSLSALIPSAHLLAAAHQAAGKARERALLSGCRLPLEFSTWLASLPLVLLAKLACHPPSLTWNFR